MRKSILFSLLILLFTLFPALAFADVSIVATLPTLGSIASEIVGTHGSVKVMASPVEDPHFVDARPDYVLKLNQADVLLYNGMELEIGWLPTLQTSARNAKVAAGGNAAIDCSQFIKPLEVPSQKVDRAAGDIHPQGNPHYFYSADNVALITRGLSEKLATLDEENAAYYKTNAENFIQKLNSFSKTQKNRFSALPNANRQFISYHASMPYLAEWLGLTSTGTIEPKPGISPNPQHVAKTVASMKASATHVIIQESYQPTSTSEKMASMTSSKIIRLNNGPDFNKGESYIQYITAFCDALYDAMK